MMPEVPLQPKMEPEDDAARLRQRDSDGYRYGNNHEEEDTVFSSNGSRNNDFGANNTSCASYGKSWMENGDVPPDDSRRYSQQRQQQRQPQLLYDQQDHAGVYRKANERVVQELEEQKRIFHSFSDGGYKNKNISNSNSNSKTANNFNVSAPRNRIKEENTLVDETGTRLHRGVYGIITAEKMRSRLSSNESYDFANNALSRPNNPDHENTHTPPTPITKGPKASTISPSPPSRDGKDHTSSGNDNIHCNGNSNISASMTASKAPLVESSSTYRNGIHRDGNMSGSSIRISGIRTRQRKKSFDKRSLIELPSSHASCSKFPPGCPVVCSYLPGGAPISLDHGQNNRIKLENPDDLLRNGTDAKIRMGKVQCVFVDLSSSTRELVHLVARRRGNGVEGANTTEELSYVEERALAYAPQCPVVYTPKSNVVRDGYDGGVGVGVGDGGGDNGNVGGVDSMKGIVLLCRRKGGDPFTGQDVGRHDECDNHRSTRFVYTILLKLPTEDEGHWIKENVEQEELSFRAPMKIAKEKVAVVGDDNNVDVKGGQGGKCIVGGAGVDIAKTEEMRKMGDDDATEMDSGTTRPSRENSVRNGVNNDESRNGACHSSDKETPVSGHRDTRSNEKVPVVQHQSSSSKKENATTKEKEAPLQPRDNGKEVQESVVQKSPIASVNLKRYPRETGDVDSTNNCCGNGNTRRDVAEERPPSCVTQLQNKPNHTSSTTSGNTKVFVINLRKTDRRDELRNFFSSYGNILSLDFPLIPPGKHKCFATIEFESPESSAAVVRKNAHSFCGRKIYCVYYKRKNPELENGRVGCHDESSNDTTNDIECSVRVNEECRQWNNGNNKIFVSYLRRTDDHEDIQNYFSNFGTVVKFVRFPKRCNLGIVEFECSESAAAAVEENEHILNGHQIFVKYYVAKGQTLRNDDNVVTSIDIPIDDYLTDDDQSEFEDNADDVNRFCKTSSLLDRPLSKKRRIADDKPLAANSSNNRQRLENTGTSSHDVARRWVPPNRSF